MHDHDLYQPIDRALAAVVALSAPGVASLQSGLVQ